ncbi:hypothetical protein FDW84_01410 [Pseudarthrobacter sp. NamE5]|nr:hypothetical protein FDW84_01410 [Pseudarthrobacter sp. NamE5]
MADAMGKGTGPALLAAAVHTHLRWSGQTLPGDALAAVSTYLEKDLALDDLFVTAFSADLRHRDHPLLERRIRTRSPPHSRRENESALPQRPALGNRVRATLGNRGAASGTGRFPDHPQRWCPRSRP